MVTTWTWPAYVGVLLGTALFVALFVPALVWQYRTYGRPSVPRMLVVAAACVYAVALVAYTLLPLPTGDQAAWCAEHAAGHNTDPLAVLRDLRAEQLDHGLRATVRSWLFLQVALNVVLFVPFGVLARVLLRWGVLVTTLAGAGTSLLVELTQYTGAFGLVPCSYRVADVDDVLANTAGALLGALLAPALLRLVPSSRRLAADRTLARPVTVWRRWAGMALDALLATLLAAGLVVGWRVVLLVTGATRAEIAASSPLLLAVVLPFVAVFLGPSLVGSGASLGQRVVWLRPRWPGRRASRARSCARGLVVGGLWWLLTSATAVPGIPDPLGDALVAAGWLLAAVAVGWVPAARRGLSGALTGALVVDAREPAPPPRHEGADGADGIESGHRDVRGAGRERA